MIGLDLPKTRRHTASTSLTTVTMAVTPEMLAVLEQLSHDTGKPLEVVLTHAIGLYREALRVTTEGKHVGYATSPNVLDVEFTGFVGSEER